MRLPPPGDQEEFYGQLLKVCRSPAENACIMLLWRTGMHASTLCSAHWWRGPERTIIWRRPKTGKQLAATITNADCILLAKCRAGGHLPTSVRTLERWVQRVGERAGYPGLCPLTLRHSRAIFLLDKGLAVNRVASLLGCSYGVLEKHYAQIEAARLVI